MGGAGNCTLACGGGAGIGVALVAVILAGAVDTSVFSGMEGWGIGGGESFGGDKGGRLP
jgi:hypothetical protein